MTRCDGGGGMRGIDSRQALAYSFAPAHGLFSFSSLSTNRENGDGVRGLRSFRSSHCPSCSSASFRPALDLALVTLARRASVMGLAVTAARWLPRP